MIKAYSIRFEDEGKKTIDTHLRIDRELEEKRRSVLQASLPQGNDEFVEGLKAVVIDQIPNKEESTAIAMRIVEEAKKEAKDILEKAKKDVEKMKNEAYNEAQKKGYEEGQLLSKKELQKLNTEFDVKSRQLQKEYDTMLLALEPQMADIIGSLLEKLTGIVVEDKEEVILYLVNKTLKNLEKFDEYTIRVSKEDFEYISMRKNLLLNAIGREVPLYIVEDSSLKKNQCFIETDLRVINCSLDIQLNNLIMDLKLIAGI